ncbi:class E sortase [Georgenia halophila]|uniref:Class E sortase n=1 Tax=Georgenia halophila TaxID=620889 RepID=A0ABP8KT74_9MICO
MIAWTVGLLGEVMVTAGVLLGLFVVWQVFWTDVQSSRAAQDAVERMHESYEPPAATGEQPTGPQTGAPPVIDAPAEGTDFGILHVPRWGEDHELPIAEGVGLHDVLNTGAAGHYPSTSMPGEVGNFALAAHRQTYGAAFHKIDQLQNGDQIVVWTPKAWLVYEVSESYVVTPDQTDVVAPVPGNAGAEATERVITLTTCHPLWSTRERYIVHGEFVEWYAPSPADDMPEELRENV